MNIIDESGALALATRLQRLSEQLRKDGALLYKAYELDFEPKWFPVIYALYHKHTLSIMEIAEEIGYSHPSTITLLRELEKKKLVRSKKDKNDERKRLIQLTAKGHELLKKMQPIWAIITQVLADISNNEHHLLKAIEQAEENIRQQSFLQRALTLKTQKDD